MHAKERVIGPILQDELGLIIELAVGVNTDQFGKFSREVGRSGSQLDAARAKIAADFEYAPSSRVGFATDGRFGPHTYIPFPAIGHEIVLMVARTRDARSGASISQSLPELAPSRVLQAVEA
jgi:hypothetical protein